MPTALAPVLNLSANADPSVVSKVWQKVARWRGVMAPTCTINVKGRESVAADFIFVPALIFDGKTQEAIKRSFEDFIVALFTLVGVEEGNAPWWGQYVRRIDYHKLGEQGGAHGSKYLVKHSWDTRLCVKLLREGEDKVLLYGYTGMGLPRRHPDWWSLVVRSRNAGLTARLLRVLGLHRDCRPEDFVNRVSRQCARTYEESIDIIRRSLAARGGSLSEEVGASTEAPTTEEAGASTDGSEESEGGGLHGGGGTGGATGWSDGEE